MRSIKLMPLIRLKARRAEEERKTDNGTANVRGSSESLVPTRPMVGVMTRQVQG